VLFFFLMIITYKHQMKNIRWFIVSLMIGILLILPSINYLQSRESRLRFQEVSIFNNLKLIEDSNKRIAYDDSTFLAKIIHNRRVIYIGDFLKHYFDNFSGRFLFTHGDGNPRLAIQNMGQLYVWTLPFLIAGLFFLIKRKREWKIYHFWLDGFCSYSCRYCQGDTPCS